MRLPDSAIRAAILHAEEEVRLAALSFFSGSFSQDEAVMPLVVEAVQRYGRASALGILRGAEHLPQTRATVDWLVDELGRDYALERLEDDNYRFAIALILCQTQPQLLVEREREIAALSMFPGPLRGPIEERREMLHWDWERGFRTLEALGRYTLRKRKFTSSEGRYALRILEALARHRATRAGTVLNLLQGRYEEGKEALLQWLKPLIIRLAGAMRIGPAIPVLLGCLDDNQVSAADASTTALVMIDTDALVSAIADKWWHAAKGFRAAASDVLEHVHTDLCLANLLEFFNAEEDGATKVSLAYALLSQFAEDAVEPVRQLVLKEGDWPPPDGLDLRGRLVVACTVMGVRFPEFEQWHEEAVANHWGLGDYTPPRLADSYRPD